MKKLRLSSRLVLLLAFPLAGAVTFGGYATWIKGAVAREYGQVRITSQVLSEVGNVIHELQRERGRSAVFVGQRGAKFAAELPVQQRSTDAALEKFQQSRHILSRSNLGDDFTHALERSLAAIGKLPQKRESITAFAITAPESTLYFTQTIAELLRLIGILSHKVSDAHVANGIACYVNYIEAKEQAGIERAVLSGVFSAGKFSGDALNRLNQAVASQQVFLRVFDGFASPAQRELHAATVRGDVVDLAHAMRLTALEKASAGGFGIESAAWFDAITGKIDLMKTVEDRLAADYNAIAQIVEAAARRSFLVLGTLTAAILALTAMFGIWVIRSITRPLQQIMSELTTNASQTRSAASQVSESSQSLASGAADQASQLEETSAALVQMGATTKRNQENAQQAKDFSHQTRQSAEASTHHVDEMRRAMDAIKVSSDGISRIIKTIDEIAFQTNILALNAAVEAARAGEAGMGFAVVAEEVRNLAQRSAQSAKETAAKIEDAIQRSEHGVQISATVAQALGDILEKARKVDGYVAEIAESSVQQSQGIDQVQLSAGRMDKITQTNAGSAEETAAAAEELNAQAGSLQEAVNTLAALVGGRGSNEAPAEPVGVVAPDRPARPSPSPVAFPPKSKSRSTLSAKRPPVHA